MAEKSGNCYIDVWRDTDFRGETIRIHGPAEYPTLGFTHGNWGRDIGSLRVGPNAFVMAYRRSEFRDKLITFGPFDECADLSEFRFEDEIESMKVIDSLKIFDRVGYNVAPDADAADAEPSGGCSAEQPNANKGRRRQGKRR